MHDVRLQYLCQNMTEYKPGFSEALIRHIFTDRGEANRHIVFSIVISTFHVDWTDV